MICNPEQSSMEMSDACRHSRGHRLQGVVRNHCGDSGPHRHPSDDLHAKHHISCSYPCLSFRVHHPRNPSSASTCRNFHNRRNHLVLLHNLCRVHMWSHKRDKPPHQETRPVAQVVVWWLLRLLARALAHHPNRLCNPGLFSMDSDACRHQTFDACRHL